LPKQKAKKNKGKKRKEWWDAHRARGSRSSRNTHEETPEEWSPVSQEHPEEQAIVSTAQANAALEATAAQKPKSGPVTPPWRRPETDVIPPRRAAETEDLLAAIERQVHIAEGRVEAKSCSCHTQQEENVCKRIPPLFVSAKRMAQTWTLLY